MNRTMHPIFTAKKDGRGACLNVKLFHTGNVEIQNDIYRGRQNADSGQGFYLRSTYRWAGRNAIINEYEMDMSGLTVHVFSRNTD